MLFNIIPIYGGNNNVSYWLAQNSRDSYLIGQEFLSGCNSKEEISKRLSEVQEDFAARRYVIMGYDKDSDKLYLMQAADTLSEATALAQKVWETDNQRTDTNRERNGVPDLDWFELYEQESGSIDYSKRLAVFYGQSNRNTNGVSFSVRFDEGVQRDVRDEIEKAMVQDFFTNYPSYISFYPDCAYNSENECYDCSQCFEATVYINKEKLSVEPSFFLTTLCNNEWHDYSSLSLENIVEMNDKDFAYHLKQMSSTQSFDFTGTLVIEDDGIGKSAWKKEFHVSHSQVIEATSLTKLINDCIEAEHDKEHDFSSEKKCTKAKHRSNGFERQ